MKKKKGFTLVELLAVIVILAILATAAFTLVLPQIEKSRKKSFVSEAANIIDSAELYFLDHPTAESVSIEELKPYIKNYDSSKTGCICPPKEGPNAHGYMIRFSNGDYKTYLDGFYEIEGLKTSSGSATEVVVKIDDNNPNWNYSATNPACPTTCPTSPSQAKPSDSNNGTGTNPGTTPGSGTNTNPGTNSDSGTTPGSGTNTNSEPTTGVHPPQLYYHKSPTGAAQRISNAATKCAEQHVTTYPQDCSDMDQLYRQGLLEEYDYENYLNKILKCTLKWDDLGALTVSCTWRSQR